MKNSISQKVAAVSQALRAKRRAPDFWAFLRSLENANKDNPRYGRAKRPGQENVRLSQEPHLHFPASDVASVEPNPRPRVDAAVSTYFFGLLGVNGPMPLEFTSYVLQRSQHQHDNTWRRFLDILHHRFHILFYRARVQNEQSVSHDRPNDDPIANIVRSLSGTAAGPANSPLPLAFAGGLGAATKTRWGLEDMLRRLFPYSIAVEDFSPGRYDIPHGCRAILGRPENSTLGVNLQIGRTYMSVTQRFTVRIGPVNFAGYQYFVQGMEGLSLLHKAIRMYLDRPLDYTVVFHLKTWSIPIARLGFDWERDDMDAAQLGYSAWIGSLDSDATTLAIDGRRIT
jgi:type VI secretion system protein ImpH